MEAAHTDLPVRDFVRPSGIVEHEVCATSGARPNEHCPQRIVEVFAENEPPLDEEHDWYQMVSVDTFSGLLANEFCPDHAVEQLMVVIKDERGREWAQAHPEALSGLPLAPVEYCTESTGRAQVAITQPTPGSTVYGTVAIYGTVEVPDFDRYEVQYGIGDNPQGWGWISGPHLAQVRDGLLAEWDTAHLSPGVYTVRITAFDRAQHRIEARGQVVVAPPTEEPTPAPSPTPMPSPTPSAMPTVTSVPTAEPTFTPTAEPSPTLTYTPEPSPSATQAPASPTAEEPGADSTPTAGPTSAPEEAATEEASPTATQ
jgi:hypothetical protein